MEESHGYAASLIDKIKEGAASRLDAQKDRTTDGLNSVVGVVRQGTEKLRDEDHDTIAQYVDQAASQLDRVAQHLRTKRTSELLQDAQRFARRNPVTFIGSAFAVGLVAARFFKSSAGNGNSDDWRQPAGSSGVFNPPHLEPDRVGTSGSAVSEPTPILSRPATVTPTSRPSGRRPTGSSSAPVVTPFDPEVP